MNHLPSKLVKLRKHYNYSQNHLAKVLDVDVLEYMGYENGRSVLGYNQIKKLASFYHISFTELFTNSDNVTLFDVKQGSTDEINITYFLKEKTWVDKLKDYIKIHPYRWYGCLSLMLMVAIGLFVLFRIGNEPVPYVPVLNDTYRLGVSETTVVYIDSNGILKGSGDNSSGQISNLSSDKVIKVVEGSTFTVALRDDGTLQTYGLLAKYAKQAEELNNIVDIAAGSGHLVAVDSKGRVYAIGDNGYGQCNVSSFGDVVRVYATETGTIGIRNDGKAVSCGSFMGSSMLKNHDFIMGIDSSQSCLALIEGDNSVYYYSKSASFPLVASWKNITDIACGNNFIAALDNEGHVYIDVDNDLIKKEVSNWENIIAIGAGEDYLVAFDGENIYGVGKNNYHQFEVSESLKTALPMVSNVKVTIDGDYLAIQFDKVANASEYIVSIDAGIGYSTQSVANVIKFDLSILEDDKSYKITIITVGEGDYENSQPYSFDYTYHGNDNKEEDNTDDSTVVETPFTIDLLIGKTRTNFEAYLLGLGVDPLKMNGIEAEQLCESEEAIILSVDGIEEYEKITSSALKERSITYMYCKVVYE